MNKQDIIDISIKIAEEYRDDYGLTLTLRQLYYQHVARGHSPNGDKFYKRIGQVLGQARLNGEFPIEYIEDRGRTVGLTQAQNILSVNKGIANVAQNLSQMPFWLSYGRWWGQPTKASVWVEKEALSGVLEGVCEEWEVGLFPCKGYPSISALSGWINDTHSSLEEGEEAVILYLGDHDPDGLQIPISAEKTIRQIMEVENKWFPFRIERIALTREQIRKYNPPPMVAKKTSARYASYKRKTGLDDAWELDALDPPVMQKLVKTHLKRIFDDQIYQDALVKANVKRLEMIDRICEDPSWIEEQLRKFV